MDRRTRKELKSDKFAEQVTHGFEFVTEHTAEIKRYGPIVAAVIVIAAAIFFYMRYQSNARADALAQAIAIDNATVGGAPNPSGGPHYPNADEKQKARAKAFGDLAAKYHGSQEGAIAEMYLASDAVDAGKLAEAEKRYRDVVDSAPAAYSSIAKLSLARVLAAEGKDAEAEKILRDLAAHPTVSVSKDQAQIELALIIGKKNPDEARKILEPLRVERAAISRAAVQALGEVQGIK